ncbi:MAG: FG-GAP-like repeat-containing protein [Panacagrimonas sp.]
MTHPTAVADPRAWSKTLSAIVLAAGAGLTGTALAQSATPLPPSVSIGNASVAEGNTGTTALNLPLTRTGDTRQNIVVQYGTNDNTGANLATAGTDYTALTAVASLLAPGATTLNLPVSVTGDTAVEPDETFLLHLTSAHNAGPTPSFAGATSVAIGPGPGLSARGDFNLDGKSDLAVANFNSNTVSILLNTTVPGASSASFADPANVVVGMTPRSVAVGDFNGDGRPDLAVASAVANGSSSILVLLNTTAPGASGASFATGTDLGPGSGPISVAVGDFNGDGRPDLAVANANANNVSVLLNTTVVGESSVSFTTAANFGAGTLPSSVTAGDLNGDGRPDLAVTNQTSGNVSVLLNTTVPGASSADFATAANFGVGPGPRSVAVGDLNGDGRPDLTVANFTGSTFSVLLNTIAAGGVSASFAPSVNFTVGSGTRDIAVGDLNGDGRPDLAITNRSNNNVSILLNAAAPGASSPAFGVAGNILVGTQPTAVLMDDLNGDGRLDLSVTNFMGNTVSFLLNTTLVSGNGASFATAGAVVVGASPSGVAVGDLNGDGRPDLAVTNSDDNNVSVLLNVTAPGASPTTYAAAANVDVGAFPTFVSSGDLNSDGRPDLVVTNTDSDTVSVLLNAIAPGATSLTSASFAPAGNFDVGSSPVAVAVRDLNGDGRPDLTVTNRDSDDISVLLNAIAPGATNLNPASFAAAQNFDVGTTPISVSVGDLNGDGQPDLAVANFSDDNVSVLLNAMTPGATSLTPESFATAENFGTGAGPAAVALGDLNGDGRPDLATGNFSDDNVSVLLNAMTPGATSLTAASFAAAANFDVGANPSFMVVADLNGDSRPDLAVANFSDDTVSVLLNAVTPGATSLIPASYAAAVDFEVGTGPGFVTVGDLNGDGRPDLATANFGSLDMGGGNTVSVLLNRLYPVTIATNEATATIQNDDAAPTGRSISIADVTVSEGNSGTGKLRFKVRLSAAATHPVTVRFASANGTARSGSDYTAKSGTITFAPGVVQQQAVIVVKGDRTREPNETLFVNLSMPSSGTTIADSQGRGTISNDD